MRSKFFSAVALLLIATPAFAQEAAALAESAAKPSLLTPSGGLMFWTLIIFALVFFILSKFAFGPITAAVQAREAALEAAIAAAQADRDAAAKLLEEHKKNIENARNEAQRFIAEGRATAESMKSEMLEATKKQQDEMLERARRDIESEKTTAIDSLRKEAIDLAIAGASKVIEQNLDDAKNRTLIENYLASIGTR
jgi:F-type H+-transporting ATPase subunit b